ncbi:hypothetical protein CPB86DRAFT_22230 [Serendipita vermifera]|nr:hypothetical protein CPB86DRAFT_22230 [Serendipita vermifera]
MDFETDTDIAQASSSTSLNQQTLSNTVSLRSSARLRTARERLQQESNQANSSTANAADTLSRASKSDKGKRRASFPQTARPRRSNPAVQPLTLNEPVPDRKGKKRISQPSEDLSADEDESTHLPPPKRLRTSLSSYSLRSRNPPKGQRKSAMSNKSK